MKVALLLFLLLIYHATFAQRDNELLLSINAQIDEAVVKKNISILEKHYADDFVFTHGTGFVEGKASWIKNVANPNTQFVTRAQDSTTVELHDDVALVIGKIDITRKGKDKDVVYGIWYIRVYRKKHDLWRMISHRTTREWHL